MIDRDYLQFSTYIGGDSRGQKYEVDEKGNVKAEVMLSLPDNIFSSQDTAKKLDSVRMLATKVRLSMQNTPLCAIPLDSDLSTTDTPVSTCQMDVYPFCLLDDGQIKPESGDSALSLPHYKDHTVNVTIHYMVDDPQVPDGPVEGSTSLVTFTANSPLPSTAEITFLEECGVIKQVTHMMNLVAKSNHEPFAIAEGELLLNNQGSLEQLFQDAIENAITYASTEDTIAIDVYAVHPMMDDTSMLDTLTPKPDVNIYYTEPMSEHKYYYWKKSVDDENSSATCYLNNACKPRVIFNEQSITIAYDSAAFDSMIPVLWNPPFVNTYDQPEQMTIDSLRKEVWTEPPPKRMYKYDVATEQGDVTSYEYGIPSDYNCGPLNIICNQAMKDIFSFMPWIPLEISKLPSSAYFPNLTFGESEKYFYILDGTAAQVDIGNQEIIKNTKEEMINIFVATDSTTITTEQRRKDLTIFAGSLTAPIPYPLTSTALRSCTTPLVRQNYHITGDNHHWPTNPNVRAFYITYYSPGDATDSAPNGTVEWFFDGVEATSSTSYSARTSGEWGPYSQIGTETQEKVVYLNETRDAESSSTTVELDDHLKDPYEYTDNGEKITYTMLLIPTGGQVVFAEIKQVAGLPEEEGLTNKLFVESYRKPPYALEHKIEYDSELASYEHTIYYELITGGSGEDVFNYYTATGHEFTTIALRERVTTEIDNTATEINNLYHPYDGNIRLSFTWNNLPTVVLSPISSIVLQLDGMSVSNEIYPVNMTEIGGATLTNSIPLVENYFMAAQTLRDLHDELTVTKDSFNDAAYYTVARTGGQERNFRIRAMYITKDGKLHQIYIPKHGIFYIRLTFSLSYYYT